jgi:hypothetical protein
MNKTLPNTVYKCAVLSYSFISTSQYYRNVITYRPSVLSQNHTSLLELEPYLSLYDIENRLVALFPALPPLKSLNSRENEDIQNLKSSSQAIFQQYLYYYRPLYDEEAKTNTRIDFNQLFLQKEVLPLIECLSTENVSSLRIVQKGAAREEATVEGPSKTNDASKYLTVVSGYWKLNKHKYSPDGFIWNASFLSSSSNASRSSPYEAWFTSSLQINMPYIIFTDEATIPSVTPFRHQTALPTVYLVKNLSSFQTFSSYNTSWIHPLHVPSVEVGMIWLEKIHLLKLASQMVEKPFLAWIDAGLSRYRHHYPPLANEWSSDVLFSLPMNRISYIYVEEEYHSFASGVMIIPKQLIALLEELFYQEYEVVRKEINDWRCGSEQFVLTRIRDKYPHLFHSMSYEYGDIDFLWGRKKS